MHKDKKLNNFFQQTIFIGPALLFFTILVLIPFCMGVGYSFTKWNGISSKVSFVGFTNFTSLLSDDNFIKAFWFTARFSVVTVFLGNFMAFVLAMLLTTAMKMKNIFRAAFFLPNVISGFILGFIWQFIFVKVFAGIGDLTNIAFFQLPWLGTPATGFWATVIVQLWQMSGYLMIIYIAGISSVPKELQESFKIDGANRLQTLKYLTLPMIMPSITISLFLSINTAFKLFDLNYSLTHGNFDTRGLAFDIYTEAFTNNNYGLGTAKALFFFLVVATITILQTLYTKRKEIDA
jgi:raffinose/stachyose/melibiose transport system permease protein